MCSWATTFKRINLNSEAGSFESGLTFQQIKMAQPKSTAVALPYYLVEIRQYSTHDFASLISEGKVSPRVLSISEVEKLSMRPTDRDRTGEVAKGSSKLFQVFDHKDGQRLKSNTIVVAGLPKPT